jgi:hypothetical protein
MANSIRTPKPGTPKHIAEAVDDEEWQKFRLSLKGISTKEKLDKLVDYYHTETNQQTVDIRVDNYLKALARGGQIAVTSNYLEALLAHKLVVRK